MYSHWSLQNKFLDVLKSLFSSKGETNNRVWTPFILISSMAVEIVKLQ